MSKKFLAAVDGSEHGWKALDLAANLANVSDAELLILHVIPHEPMPEGLKKFADVEGLSSEEIEARHHLSRTIADEIAREAESRVRAGGLGRVETQVVEGNPANEIVAMAEASGADMLFVGSRGLGDVKGLLMGSVSHKVMHLASCSCVAVK